MVELLNWAAALTTIAFGAFGFLAPRYTLTALDLVTTNTTMGLSEMRASVGGLFVALGVAALIINAPWVYVAIGIAYTGAAIGRIVSLIFDAPPTKKLFVFGGIEAGLALWLIAANASAF
ncbi:MAG: DUF4345 family protein [Planktomarina sp.]